MSEPTLAIYHGRTLGNRILTLVAATRPAFLTASILPVLAAGALVHHIEQRVSLPLLALACVNIALIHAGANVLNDYFDGLSGTDASNNGRVFPFSGGSRFIQNSVLSLGETRNLGVALTAAGAILGLVSVYVAGPLLLAIGLIGGLLAVGYTAPPCLACRGLGDVAVGLAFGVLPMIGTTWILMHAIPEAAWWLGGSIACFVAAILWANSIPDIPADRQANKLTVPVRLGPAWSARMLPVWFAAGFGLLVAAPVPPLALLGLIGIAPATVATRAILAQRYLPALPMTILTHAVTCALLTLGLWLAG